MLVLDSPRPPSYNPSHSEVVREIPSDREEGQWLKAFAEKNRRSRLKRTAEEN